MIVSSSCPVRKDLERLLLAQASDAEVDALETHVSQCSHCLEVIRTLNAEDDLVEEVRLWGKKGDLPPEAANIELMARLHRLRKHTALATMSGARSSSLAPGRQEGIDLSGLLSPSSVDGELGRIGPYGIVRVLGRGGMGVVLEGRQRHPQRLVALKMLLSGPWASPDRLARFHNEANAIARLAHPNIVQVYEAREHGGAPYFTMELVEGGNLAQKLAAAPLAPRAAAELLTALAGAVHFAHDHGIVHRDLKPANVLLTADGTPKIGDFGLAKHLEADTAACRTETNAILGTPPYMAPEQTAGNRALLGPAVDIYALGAILYECLTGRPPFRAATVLETLDQLRSREPVPPARLQPGVPRDLQTICLKCLNKEPARRYASARELADDLGRFLRGEPIRARPVTMLERLWKWARRKPALAAMTALSALFLAALVVANQVYNAQLQATARVAVAEKERTNAGYREACATLNKIISRLGEEGTDSTPQMRELYRAQMEDAMAFYLARLEEQASLDPNLCLEIATACYKAATMQGLLGRSDAALPNYQRSIDLLEGLPADAVGMQETERLALLAHWHSDRGRHAAHVQQWELAERSHRRALEVVEHLLELEPRSTRWKQRLAECEHNIGNLCRMQTAFEPQSRLAEAEAHYKRCQAIHKELLQADERVPVHQIVDITLDLAMLYQFAGRVDEASRTYEEAEAVLGSEAARKPLDMPNQLALPRFYTIWGDFLRTCRAEPEAVLHKARAVELGEQSLARHNRAVELAEAALRQEPAHRMPRSHAANAHEARARTYEFLQRFTEAIADWDRVVVLNCSPDPAVNHAWRALALARAGEHRRCCDEANVIAEVREVSDYALCVLVRAYAVCVRSVQAGPATAGQGALAEDYARRALALLESLHGRKHFQVPLEVEWLRTDKDLDPLRERRDFRRFLEDLEKHKQP